MSIPSRRARPARVLLADDHALVRRGIRHIIDAEPDLTVVDEVGDGAAAVERVGRGDVDLVILDVSMPRMTGLQAAREIQRRGDDVVMLFLSMHDNEQYLFQALRNGAAGYVHKSVADRDLIVACRAALRGKPFLYPGAVATLIREYISRGEDPGERGILTPREEEVLKLIAEGHSGKEIADLAGRPQGGGAGLWGSVKADQNMAGTQCVSHQASSAPCPRSIRGLPPLSAREPARVHASAHR